MIALKARVSGQGLSNGNRHEGERELMTHAADASAEAITAALVPFLGPDVHAAYDDEDATSGGLFSPAGRVGNFYLILDPNAQEHP